MPDTLLAQGLMLMLTGMGTVFVFLSVLVIAMSAMSRLLGREPQQVDADADPDAETVAAIAAVIERHRRRKP